MRTAPAVGAAQAGAHLILVIVLIFFVFAFAPLAAHGAAPCCLCAGRRAPAPVRRATHIHPTPLECNWSWWAAPARPVVPLHMVHACEDAQVRGCGFALTVHCLTARRQNSNSKGCRVTMRGARPFPPFKFPNTHPVQEAARHQCALGPRAKCAHWPASPHAVRKARVRQAAKDVPVGAPGSRRLRRCRLAACLQPAPAPRRAAAGAVCHFRRAGCALDPSPAHILRGMCVGPGLACPPSCGVVVEGIAVTANAAHMLAGAYGRARPPRRARIARQQQGCGDSSGTGPVLRRSWPLGAGGAGALPERCAVAGHDGAEGRRGCGVRRCRQRRRRRGGLGRAHRRAQPRLQRLQLLAPAEPVATSLCKSPLGR